MSVDFDSYLSPFSWRYASPEMRALWSEREKRLLWRRIWLALAKVQSGYGLVSAEQLADLAAHAAGVDITMVPGGTVPDAMRQAAHIARAGDRVVVFGSFHTVGPALSCV